VTSLLEAPDDNDEIPHDNDEIPHEHVRGASCIILRKAGLGGALEQRGLL
jgi:hypothetical protein